MKKTLILIVALLTVTSVMAQTTDKLSKEEKKHWKQEARKYKKNPALLKSLIETQDEALEEAQIEIDLLQHDTDSLKLIVTAYAKEKAANTKKVSGLQQQLDQQKALVAKMKSEAESKADKFAKGVTFRVQIGAFTKRDMSQFFDNTERFHGEVQKGMQKYTVGIFHDKSQAQAFRAHLVAIGIKDAWIVKYIDGQRVVDKGAVVANFE